MIKYKDQDHRKELHDRRGVSVYTRPVDARRSRS